MGPLLYLIYKRNIKNAESKAKYKIFADETNLLYKAKDESTLQEVMNSDLNRFKSWVAGNRLTLNVKKQII